MNDLLAPFYEFIFNWDSYKQLLNYVYQNNDYGKFGLVLFITPIVLLLIFYKIWDPVRKSGFKLFITLLFISLISYGATSGILYSNSNISQYIGNYNGTQGSDPDYFIFQMSMMSFFFAAILSFIFSIILRNFSSGNRHNPF